MVNLRLVLVNRSSQLRLHDNGTPHTAQLVVSKPQEVELEGLHDPQYKMHLKSLLPDLFKVCIEKLPLRSQTGITIMNPYLV